MPFWKREPEQRALTRLDLRPLMPLSSITPATALANPDVWSAVRCLSDAAASCPLLVYRRLGDGERRRISNRTADLLRAPAENTTQANLVSTVMLNLLLHGNSYIGKFRGDDGRVEQLLPLAPDRVQVERRAGRIVFRVSDERGRQSEHDGSDVLHVKALSLNGLTGLSPIAQMRHALELNTAVRAAATGLFANQARPSGILKVAGQGTDEIEQLKLEWNARHSGERQGGTAIVTGDISFEPIAMSADDAQFVAARKLSSTEIARVFRIPPWMLGCEDGGSLTYSNVESQAIAFVSYGLRPWLVAIEQAFALDKDLFTPTTYCEFKIDALLRADSKTRSEVYSRALDPRTGWMRRDEVRKLENLEPESPDDLAALVANTTTNGAGAKIA